MQPGNVPSRTDGRTSGPGIVRAVTEPRSEYTSARTIGANIEHRLSGSRLPRHPGYGPPEIDYTLEDGSTVTIAVRDCDVRYLDRVGRDEAIRHVELIHRARRGAGEAAAELTRRMAVVGEAIAARFRGRRLTDNEYVVPYTSSGRFTEEQISQKGAILLRLFQQGFATADFTLLSASACQLPRDAREQSLRDAIADLEMLSGRQLGNPENPLLIAIRSAMPAYIPGFMPTYLNVGLTPAVLPGLPARYGEDGASRIRLNARRTLLEALDPDAYAALVSTVSQELTRAEADEQSRLLEDVILQRAPGLLAGPVDQVRFFVDKAYRYYADHLDVLRNFMPDDTHYPAIIVQRMVCSVLDDRSYAGMLYSRHPRQGSGVFLQYATAVFGEELMTGRLAPKERHFRHREEARDEFPAVYHFWPRLFQLEEIFRSPVMVEFTGVHGTFTVLQVNAAELAGSGMLTAVIDMYRSGEISAERVRELIKPYHVRQIESDAIDPRSIRTLEPFGRGVSVLPRSAVTGRLAFQAEAAHAGSGCGDRFNLILAKARFTPQDAMEMQRVNGICSLSPAAIHVVTTAQNLGIPSLLNLEEDDVRIDPEGRRLINAAGRVLGEGDWVTISSRTSTLYAGRALFAPARLLRFMAGEAVELSDAERPRFAQLAEYYREYRAILECVDAAGFHSLQDLGHAIRYGQLRDSPERARDYVNRCFDARAAELAARLLDTTLGTHLINVTAFDLLTRDRKIRLFKAAAASCRRRGLSGYSAGAFVIGNFVDPASSVSFWEHLDPGEIAFLINEWILHQKYLDVIESIGEKELRRAKQAILAGELAPLARPEAAAARFIRLKLSQVDVEEVLRAVPEGADPQCAEIVGILARPIDALVDFADAREVARLRVTCEAEGVRMPGER